MKKIISILLCGICLQAQADTITRFTLGSCFAPQLSDTIWPVMKSYQPQLHLALGDNVYQSTENHQLQQPFLAEAYQLLRQKQGFISFAKEVEILPIWDDHDYGFNDAGKDFKPKKRSQQLFNQMWNINKGDPRAQREGIYYAKSYGQPGKQAQFILLDTRYFKTEIAKLNGIYPIVTDEDATMLGKAQWQWLAQQLKKPADIRFIATSVQLLTTNKQGEGWYYLPKERKRLLDLIKQAGNVIVLSGDRHYANFYRHNDLIEITSSSLNLPITGQAKEKFADLALKEPFAQGAGVFDANFGLVDIDWQKRHVNLSIVNQQKTVVKTTKVKF